MRILQKAKLVGVTYWVLPEPSSGFFNPNSLYIMGYCDIMG